MNPSDHDLEARLRAAPKPQPPAGLKSELLADARASGARPSPYYTVALQVPWWRRWWPALATGSLAMVCLGVLGMQQSQLRELRRSIDDLQQQVQRATPTAIAPKSPTQPIADGRAELENLRQVAQDLTAQVRTLESLQAENAKLRSQINLQSAQQAQANEEVQFMQQQRDKADRIRCVNNLKQLGLAVRIWGVDNGDKAPPDVMSLQAALAGNASLLVCPSDPNRKPASNWQSLTTANISYEYLGASADFTEPSRVLFRCAIHGNVALMDGSVQSGVGLSHPEWFVQRNGYLYMESPRTPGAPAGGMSPEMRQRYGLSPQPDAAGSNPAPQYRMSDAMRKRYGLMMRPADTNATPNQ